MVKIELKSIKDDTINTIDMDTTIITVYDPDMTDDERKSFMRQLLENAGHLIESPDVIKENAGHLIESPDVIKEFHDLIRKYRDPRDENQSPLRLRR